MNPECDEGNIEYKRSLKDLDKNRLEEYITQMIWRVGEGKGEAIYYLGVENDGTFYNWSELEKKQSLKTLKIITVKANLKIAKLEKINYIINNNEKNYYLRIVIRETQKILPEKRILLLGSSGIGKSTFIANIVLSKIGEEARMYLFNHKHEIIKKKTSSFNYMYIIYNNIKWVLIEVPGDDKYTKIRNKIILSFGSTINCCLFLDEWNKKEYYSNYFYKMNIPCVDLNLYSLEKNCFPNYNCKIEINKDDFFRNLILKCKEIPQNKKTEFIILESFVSKFNNNIILTGILKGGSLNINKEYLLHLTNQIIEIKIKSIHLDGNPLNKVFAPNTVSICIDSNSDYICSSYTGIITEEYLNKINDFTVHGPINKSFIVYKDNKVINNKDLKNSYLTNDKIFLVENGLGIIF
jgi:GTPase